MNFLRKSTFQQEESSYLYVSKISENVKETFQKTQTINILIEQQTGTYNRLQIIIKEALISFLYHKKTVN